MLQPHWPSDELFVRELTAAPLYQGQYPCNIVMQVLQRLDLSYGNRESKLDPEATTEHVMPQTIGSDANGRAWREMLGLDWERVHVQCLHTIGNLPVTRTNSEMSNRAFLGQKGKREWLAKSLFEMNRRIAQNERWTEDEIRERADYFGGQALKLWPAVDTFTAAEPTAPIP